jgi:hypothetical protein
LLVIFAWRRSTVDMHQNRHRSTRSWSLHVERDVPLSLRLAALQWIMANQNYSLLANV